MILNSATAYFLDLWRTTVCEQCSLNPVCKQFTLLFLSPRLSGRVGEQLREHKGVDRDISSHCEKQDSGMSH